MDNLAETLRVKSSHAHFRVTLGFDGFVDTIVRLVRQRTSSGIEYFQTMAQWVEYQGERTGKNFSVEVENQTMKLGGNMPIMANALGNLGCQVDCIGALGFPDIHPAFQAMNQNCNLLTFSNPGITQAIELGDGKMILGEMSELNRAHWSVVKSRVGIDKIIEAVNQAHLLAMVNWGEINHGTSFWEGMLNDVLPRCNKTENRLIFFDLADFSKKPTDEIVKALALLPSFSQSGKVVLGLNRNEANAICEQLIGSVGESTMKDIAELLYPKLRVDTLLIHHRTEAIAMNARQQVAVNSKLIESPVLLTGAGDNFNAGFCMGMMLKLGLDECLQLAHAQSHFYITHGASPTMPQLINAITFSQ